MCPVTFTALAVSAGLSATAGAVVGTAVSGALIGMGATAATNLVTGQSITSGLGRGALFGAVTGGLQGAASFIGPVQGAGFNALATAGGYLGQSALGIAGASVLGSAFTALTATPDISDFSAQSPQVQQFNSQNISTTGSGGSQAASSLAQAISRSKKRKLTQEDVSDLSIDTSSFASEGLQLA